MNEYEKLGDGCFSNCFDYKWVLKTVLQISMSFLAMLSGSVHIFLFDTTIDTNSKGGKFY